MARQRRGGSTATLGGTGRDGAGARRQGGEIVGFASSRTMTSSTTSRPEAATSARELADNEVLHYTIPSVPMYHHRASVINRHHRPSPRLPCLYCYDY
ncbi:hypothetical protein BDA96_01G215300 [Sorghum bicolor]|uniref:Uncharacterized protein n=2 Tax=Sorghum bicolor TaxID=4558 RepID=A0A921RYJ3_SORBI|nr:hypothetical protein BDA96_01G215300 [Sorghum bicolor]OQU91543.1 hypothetical protein SORBI_3001G201966 [Sorghum bicolor]